MANDRAPIGLARMRKLIWLSNPSFMAYVVHTSGFDEYREQIEVDNTARGHELVRTLRERAWQNPFLFPLDALELHEWARIHDWRARQS
jgi:hypothetical protein